MFSETFVAIVGAGPYGLSIAAHLRALNVDHRVLGKPMEIWRSKMPIGMLLKSAGFASDIYDFERSFSYREFCRHGRLPYGDDIDIPIPLETFCRYGMEFQKRFVPQVEEEIVSEIIKFGSEFHIRTRRGELYRARNVVLAVGADEFRYIPKLLTHVGNEHLSHSADHREFDRFRGRRLAVIGAGASAINIAVMAHEAGAVVRLIARRPVLSFDSPWGAATRSLYKRLRYPVSKIGPGWKKKLLVELPWLPRYLPDSYRLHLAGSFFGPSGAWPMAARAAKVPQLLGYSVVEAKLSKSGVKLCLSASDGSTRSLEVDHVVAGTGYRTDVHRLSLLSADMVRKLDLIGRAPRLSASFESSISGLYFVGPVAAATFGPVMRFAAGADFTSRRISRHLASLARPMSGVAAIWCKTSAQFHFIA